MPAVCASNGVILRFGLQTSLCNLCREVYNETKAEGFLSVFAVALLAEGVDRNLRHHRRKQLGTLSPSSRRAWIEIGLYLCTILQARSSPSSRRAWIEIAHVVAVLCTADVALLAEGVDRNYLQSTSYAKAAASPSSRRAWIEIETRRWCSPTEIRRPPRGGRG